MLKSAARKLLVTQMTKKKRKQKSLRVIVLKLLKLKETEVERETDTEVNLSKVEMESVTHFHDNVWKFVNSKSQIQNTKAFNEIMLSKLKDLFNSGGVWKPKESFKRCSKNTKVSYVNCPHKMTASVKTDQIIKQDATGTSFKIKLKCSKCRVVDR